jgi:hypothetical protein
VIRKRTFAATLLLTSAVASPALAHSVPGDADPGRDLYVMVGPILSPGFRSCCGDEQEGGFADVGVEVSAFKFVPGGGTILFQPGYGALVQAQVGGIPLREHAAPKDPSTHLRLAVGGEGTVGLLGAQAGVMTRIGDGTYGTAVGPFAGLFCTIGVFSAGIQLDLPVVSSGDARMPVLLTLPVTAKWPIVIEGPRR